MVENVTDETEPGAVIHYIACTTVDMAEGDDKVEEIRRVNAGGTQIITDACKAVEFKMLYLSTDYVFNGQGTETWKPDCKDYKPLKLMDGLSLRAKWQNVVIRYLKETQL